MEADKGNGEAASASMLSTIVPMKVSGGGGSLGGTVRGHRRTGSLTKGGGGSGDPVMLNTENEMFALSKLMKAAAEVMGSRVTGSAYRAELGSAIRAVKRVRGMNEVGKEMGKFGRLKHENVLPPLAYHYREEEEKLLIFEYIPKGSLLYMLHGDRETDHAALDWLNRLKIVLGIAREGTVYLHTELNSLDIPHGNLKSGNVLLGPDFNPLLIDYGYVPLINPSVASVAMFAYQSLESLSHHRLSLKSDVYCLGIIITICRNGYSRIFVHNYMQSRTVV